MLEEDSFRQLRIPIERLRVYFLLAIMIARLECTTRTRLEACGSFADVSSIAWTEASSNHTFAGGCTDSVIIFQIFFIIVVLLIFIFIFYIGGLLRHS